MIKTFWMSFADGDKPKGQQNLGICIIDVTEAEAAEERAWLESSAFKHTYNKELGPWIGAAARKAHRLGCNPGGEVASFDLSDHEDQDWVQSLPRNQLFTGAEAEALSRQGSAWDL